MYNKILKKEATPQPISIESGVASIFYFKTNP